MAERKQAPKAQRPAAKRKSKRQAKSKPKAKAKPISANPAASLGLLARARRSR